MLSLAGIDMKQISELSSKVNFCCYKLHINQHLVLHTKWALQYTIGTKR